MDADETMCGAPYINVGLSGSQPAIGVSDLSETRRGRNKNRTHEFLERTTFSQSSLQSTSAPNLEANKNAPLNFLFRLYVSLGGGVSLFANMTGIKPLISDVTAAHSVPGPNEKGCFVVGRKGTPRDDVDLMCASSMT